MTLIDLLRSPWAMIPDRLDEIQAIYATHLRGEKIDIEAVEKRLGRPLANEQRPYEIRDGIAIVPITGVIAKRANLFTQVSGMCSSEMIGRDFKAALADPARGRETVLAIAFESGFGALQSFNRVFRESTGETPTAYRQRCLTIAAQARKTPPISEKEQ